MSVIGDFSPNEWAATQSTPVPLFVFTDLVRAQSQAQNDAYIVLEVPPMSTNHEEQSKDEGWASLCRENGWICRVCGAIPERGRQFDDNLCDDCRLVIRSE